MRDKTPPEKVKPTAAAGSHRFALGTFVTLVGQSEQTLFKITRLLPNGAAGLQYRIKNEREGYERVAIEPLLMAVKKQAG